MVPSPRPGARGACPAATWRACGARCQMHHPLGPWAGRVGVGFSLLGCLSDVGQRGACTGSQAGLTGREESLEGQAEACGALPPRRKETIGVWGSESCTRGSLLFGPLIGTSPGSAAGLWPCASSWRHLGPRTPSTQGRPVFTSRSTASEARVLSLDIYFS